MFGSLSIGILDKKDPNTLIDTGVKGEGGKKPPRANTVVLFCWFIEPTQ